MQALALWQSDHFCVWLIRDAELFSSQPVIVKCCHLRSSKMNEGLALTHRFELLLGHIRPASMLQPIADGVRSQLSPSNGITLIRKSDCKLLFFRGLFFFLSFAFSLSLLFRPLSNTHARAHTLFFAHSKTRTIFCFSLFLSVSPPLSSALSLALVRFFYLTQE